MLVLTAAQWGHAESPARWQAGLFGGQLNSAALNTVDYPGSYTVYPGPHCTTNRNAASGTYTASDTPIWTMNRTWVYWGQMYFDGGAYRFGAYMNAPLQVKVDGEVVFNVTGASALTRSGMIMPTRGWHAIEFRFFSGTTATAGPVPATTAYTWTSTFGFGVTRQYADIPSPYGYRYFFPSDDGSRTLFRHDDGTGDTASLDIDAYPSRFGTPSPDYGYVTGLTNAESRTLLADAAYANETPASRLRCTGWRLYSDGKRIAHGSGTNCAYTHSTAYVNPTLEWVWKEQNLLAFGAGAGGSVSAAGGWCDEDATLAVTATPDAGYHFYKWTGDVADGQTFAATLAVPGNKPRIMTAVFEPDAPLRDNLYKGASGGNWETASNWTLDEVPGSNDNVYIRASVNVAFSNVLDVASLVISNGACLSANFTGANIATRDRVAIDTNGGTAFGFRVRGDVTLLGNGKLFIGGHGQKAPSILEVKGSLALSGTANELAVYACPTNNQPDDFQTGGARVTVGGDTTIAAGCWIYPFTERTTGRTVIFDLRDLTVAANGGFNGRAIGFVRSAAAPCSQDTGLWTGDGQWGASHGGSGGEGSPEFGCPYAPIYPGAGGNAGNGGANIRIGARTIVLDGTLDARPGNATTSGGGGGVWITCDSIVPSPSASILAQGLDSGRGGGGGGRVAIGLGLLPCQIDELYARGGSPDLSIGSIAEVLSRPLSVTIAGGLGVDDLKNGQPGSACAYVGLADEDRVVLAVGIDAVHSAAITADPPLGYNVLAAGTNVQNATIASPAAMRVDGTERMFCAGYTLTAAAGGTWSGSGSTIASLPALNGHATLVWHFTNREYAVTGSVLGDAAGTVEVAGGSGNWVAENATATLTATPSDALAYEFQYWFGDVPYEKRHDNPLMLAMDAPKALTAFFGKRAGATYQSADSDGDWYSATRWTPNGIPGMRDKAVLNSASTKRKIRLPYYFAVQELVVSNTSLLVAAADTSVNVTYTDHRGYVSYVPATSRDPAWTRPVGFDVSGNVFIDRAGLVYVGGADQQAFTKVNIGGDLTVLNGGLQVSAGVVITNAFPTSGASGDGAFVPYTDLTELFQGENVLTVVGDTLVGPSGKIHTLNEYRCGAAVHLDLADVTVDAGGLFTAYVGGYNRFVLNNRVYTMCPGGLKTGDNKHGGSHGGRGGGQTAGSISGIAPYGFTNAPFYPGSPHGAGSSRGGGTIRMNAQSLTLNGTLISSGYTGNKGASAGGGIWVNCGRFAIGANGVVSVEGGSGANANTGSGGGGGRAAICVGLSEGQMLQLFTSATHTAKGVTVSSLAERIGARFTAEGGPAGSASYSAGTAGSGVFIQRLLSGTLILVR
jgi:hypothetical protein